MTDEMTEEVVEQIAEVVPEVVNSMNKVKLQFGLLGAAIGTAAGAVIGFVIAHRKAETKFNQIAEQEIEQMRAHYEEKRRALEAEVLKPKLEEIIEERGYSVDPPMVVTPPTAIVEAAQEAVDNEEDENEDEVVDAVIIEDPVADAIVERNVFKQVQEESDWDEHEERRKRSPLRPFVIHVDEREDGAFPTATYTYYEGDDVLCDEQDQPVEDRERLVGEQNLERFGHGSNDPDIVYIRNPPLEMDIEVIKSPNTFAEEVHGFSHSNDRSNLERMRARERKHFDDE